MDVKEQEVGRLYDLMVEMEISDPILLEQLGYVKIDAARLRNDRLSQIRKYLQEGYIVRTGHYYKGNTPVYSIFIKRK